MSGHEWGFLRGFGVAALAAGLVFGDTAWAVSGGVLIAAAFALPLSTRLVGR